MFGNPVASKTLPTSSIRRDWYQLSLQQTIKELRSDQQGLSQSEARQRLHTYGHNELEASDRRTGFRILAAQLQSSLVVLLLVAMVVSYFLGEVGDSLAIAAIVLLNTMLGFWQDFKAEKALSELKKLSTPNVIVHRGGEATSIPAAKLVPGDVIDLQSGYLVPADCRILEIADLEIDESTLTGESLPVEKSVDPIQQEKLAVADQANMAFLGTMVIRGHASAIVTATGMNTELGRIAKSLRSVVEEPTPLQIRLARLSRRLALIAILVVAIVFVAGLIAGQPTKLMLMTALSLAVAIVPEGLPAVATVALALGARRMFQRNALIRKLPAVETLGSVSVICSDKTGTLTQNKMTATWLETTSHRINLANRHPAAGELSADLDLPSTDAGLKLLLIAGALCNDAQLQDVQPPIAIGEPTEKALVEVAASFGIDQIKLGQRLPRVAEIAFDSDRKRMTTIHQLPPDDMPLLPESLVASAGQNQIAFAKGSVESILSISKFIWLDEGPGRLDDDWQTRIEQSRDKMASRGTRVLALGFRFVDPQTPLSQVESELVLLGMIGLSDPPRGEAKSAVALCRRAGIRPIMITGDHPLTAQSIAEELGVLTGNRVVTGSQLTEMSAEALRQCVQQVSVFARVAPTDKLHIVEALQDNGHVVAMTGDGVNDAPALKQAHIGVAMGQSGTDVAKQSAEMVLLDDNFATIVSAVQQGRIVYDNIRKFVKYTMSSNTGEVLVMTLGVIMGLPLPLLPLQILWINLVTDGLPGLALAVQPAEKHSMDRPPIKPDKPVFDRAMTVSVLWIGTLIGACSLGTGWLFFSYSDPHIDTWRTAIFTVLTFAQLGNAVACRSERSIIWQRNDLGNRWLWIAIGITAVLQMAVIYLPVLQTMFHTSALSFSQLLICLAASLLVFTFIETVKILPLSRFVKAV